ncbi:MAG: DMT family transporter [bacterium]|nr:DMT family transporter [bacterium]
MRSSVRWPEVALLYCAAIWGSTFYIVRDVVAELHPLTLIGWRFTIAGLLLLPFVLGASVARRTLQHLPRGGRPTPDTFAGPILGLIIFVLYAAQTWGLVYTTAANSAFITGLFIIFMPPFAFVLHRELPGGMRLLAVAIAVGGLYLLTGGIGGLNRGDLLTLIAAALYALHVLLTGRAMARGSDPLLIACQQMLVCGALGFGGAMLLGAPLSMGSRHVALMVWFLALLPTLSAYLLQLYAQRRVDALRTALIFTLEPVFGAAFAWTLGGEKLVALSAIGGLLIVIAMFVSELQVVTKEDDPVSGNFV